MAMPGKISMSFSSKLKPTIPSSSRNPPSRPPKRPQAAFDDDDEEYSDAPRVESVSHFDHTAGGAIDVNKVKEEKAPLVIPAKHKGGWRDEGRRKRQRSGLPNQEQADVAEQEAAAAKVEPMKLGLTVRKKADEPDTEAEEQHGDASRETTEKSSTNGTATTKPSEDELALQALLGEKPKSTLTIPQVSEQEAFERDFEEAPDEPTLDEYESVPVEEFGDAMLRGMGWKDGEVFGKNKKDKKPAPPRQVEKRPALLGIGAKHDKAFAEELGSWGKGSRGGKAVNTAYTPVLMRNKVTGELLTEAELKAKLDQEKFVTVDEDDSTKAITEKETGRSDKSSRKYNDYKFKDRSSRRDRSSSTDSRHKRRRRDDDYHSDRADRDRRRRERDEDYESKKSAKDHQRRDSEDDYRSERRDKESRRRDRDNDRHRDRRDDDRHRDRRDEDRHRDRRDDDRHRDRRNKDRRQHDREDDYDSERKDKDRHRRAKDDDYERRDKDRDRRDRDDDYRRKRDSRRDR